MLILHVPNALQDTTSDGIAQIFRRCFGMNVAQVNSAVTSLSGLSIDTTCAHHESRASGAIIATSTGEGGVDTQCSESTKRSNWRKITGIAVAVQIEGRRSDWCEWRESRSLAATGSLLVLWDIGATIFSVVDPLACPCRFSR